MSIRSAPAAQKRARELDPLTERLSEPGIGERVRGGVDDPHQPRPLAQFEGPARGPQQPGRGAHRPPPLQGSPPIPSAAASSYHRSVSRATRDSSQPSSCPMARATRSGTSAPGEASRRPASRPSRVRRSSTSPTSAPARCARRRRPRRADRAGRGGSAVPARRARLRLRAPARRRGRSVRRVPRRRSSGTPSTTRQAGGIDRLPERDLVRPTRRLASVALDEPIDGHLRHPPPRRQLAAGDRDQPARGLVQLGLARDVHRLARVTDRDQRPHAGVGAGQLLRAERRPEERVDRLEQVLDVRRTTGWTWSMSPS